jgi:ribosomal protein L29
MKTVEIKKNLRSQKLSELTRAVSAESEKLARSQMEVAAKKLKDFSKISKSRKQIARIYTIINEKLEEENAE